MIYERVRGQNKHGAAGFVGTFECASGLHWPQRQIINSVIQSVLSSYWVRLRGSGLGGAGEDGDSVTCGGKKPHQQE